MSVAVATARWDLGFRTLEAEHVDDVRLDVDGTVPADLAGQLFRLGPGRHDLGGERNRHWFEGDGMVQAFRFDNGRVWYRNRFVTTRKKLEEDAAGRRLYGELLTPFRGGPISRLAQLRRLSNNPANTVPVVHAGALFALCEAGHPYRLDATTLETLGEDDLDIIPSGQTYIAHAKHDPATGELWNIGFRLFPTVSVTLYRRDAAGQTTIVTRRPMPLPTIAHDFALTPTKAVIVASPAVLPRFPAGLLFQSRGLLDFLRWKPDLGTHILVIDRANGETRSYKTEPFLCAHTANAFDDDDDVVLDLCAYPDTTVALELFRDWMTGSWPQVNQGWPERLRLRANGQVERRQLAPTPFDFPRVAPRSWLGQHRTIFGVDGFLGHITALDTETGAVTRPPLGDHEHAGEPVPVPKRDARSDTDVWLLSLVLGDDDRTELRIFDGAQLDAPAVARIFLPHIAPFDFHGAWLPAGAQSTLP